MSADDYMIIRRKKTKAILMLSKAAIIDINTKID
jgi:hypothetical protein